MLQRQVEEAALDDRERAIVARVDARERARERLRIRREGARLAAKQVSRELVEQQDQREPPARARAPGVERGPRRRRRRAAEARAQRRVEGGIRREPLALALGERGAGNGPRPNQKASSASAALGPGAELRSHGATRLRLYPHALPEGDVAGDLLGGGQRRGVVPGRVRVAFRRPTTTS